MTFFGVYHENRFLLDFGTFSLARLDPRFYNTDTVSASGRVTLGDGVNAIKRGCHSSLFGWILLGRLGMSI